MKTNLPKKSFYAASVIVTHLAILAFSTLGFAADGTRGGGYFTIQDNGAVVWSDRFVVNPANPSPLPEALAKELKRADLMFMKFGGDAYREIEGVWTSKFFHDQIFNNRRFTFLPDAEFNKVLAAECSGEKLLTIPHNGKDVPGGCTVGEDSVFNGDLFAQMLQEPDGLTEGVKAVVHEAVHGYRNVLHGYIADLTNGLGLALQLQVVQEQFGNRAPLTADQTRSLTKFRDAIISIHLIDPKLIDPKSLERWKNLYVTAFGGGLVSTDVDIEPGGFVSVGSVIWNKTIVGSRGVIIRSNIKGCGTIDAVISRDDIYLGSCQSAEKSERSYIHYGALIEDSAIGLNFMDLKPTTKIVRSTIRGSSIRSADVSVSDSNVWVDELSLAQGTTLSGVGITAPHSSLRLGAGAILEKTRLANFLNMEIGAGAKLSGVTLVNDRTASYRDGSIRHWRGQQWYQSGTLKVGENSSLLNLPPAILFMSPKWAETYRINPKEVKPRLEFASNTQFDFAGGSLCPTVVEIPVQNGPLPSAIQVSGSVIDGEIKFDQGTFNNRVKFCEQIADHYFTTYLLGYFQAL